MNSRGNSGGPQQRKVNIDFNIRSATINVDQPMNVLVLWKRGKNTIDTKIKQVGPGQPVAMFNEKFQMKTQLEYDTLKRQYVRKKSDLQLWKQDMSSMLGVAEFDLSQYVTQDPQMAERTQEDRLPLKNCLIDDTAYIDILIKAKVDMDSLPAQQSPSSSPVHNRPHSGGRNAAASSYIPRMPTIMERDSESDLKEELDRKERDYLKKIVRLTGELESLRLVQVQMTQSHNEMKRKMVKKNAHEMLKDRDEMIKQLEMQLNDREDEANSLMVRNQLVIEMMQQGPLKEGVTVEDLDKHI